MRLYRNNLSNSALKQNLQSLYLKSAISAPQSEKASFQQQKEKDQMESFASLCLCGVCGKASFEKLWDLPRLPLTEKYGQYDPKKELSLDQELVICTECGHVQLKKQISAELLYTPKEYSFRTSQSNSAKRGAELFFRFFEKVRGSQTFRSFLDIGGNDLFLAKMVKADKRCVIDPICASEETQEGIQVIGNFIEKVDFSKEGLVPDLIFCRHVLEHIANPKQLLERLFMSCDENALYVFEIPCFENLIEANRFDAIFHQHYQYFDVKTFQRLIFEAGGEYLSHVYNRQGSCGGALLIAFRKGPSKELCPSLDVVNRKKEIQQAVADYQKEMELLSRKLKQFHQNIYGYGASLMLATLAYHLQTDFSELICVLDDDPQKEGIGYENLPVLVQNPAKMNLPENSNFIITSLENTRSIFQRVLQFSPRRILTPTVG